MKKDADLLSINISSINHLSIMEKFDIKRKVSI